MLPTDYQKKNTALLKSEQRHHRGNVRVHFSPFKGKTGPLTFLQKIEEYFCSVTVLWLMYYSVNMKRWLKMFSRQKKKV